MEIAKLVYFLSLHANRLSNSISLIEKTRLVLKSCANGTEQAYTEKAKEGTGE